MRKLAVVLLVCFLLVGCASRQIVDHYQGSTAQRLVTKSIDRAVSTFPTDLVSLLRGKKVKVTFNLLEGTKDQEYFKSRFLLQLRLNKIIPVETDPDYHLDVFCTSLGTDNNTIGFSTPELVTTTGNYIASIKVFGMDVFRGITEYYCILRDNNDNYQKTTYLKGESKSDKMFLLYLTIPFNDI